MGEHGDSQMVPWSHVNIAGEPFLKMREKNPKLADIRLDDIVDRTARSGWEIYERKGTTYYGIASAAIGPSLAKSVL